MTSRRRLVTKTWWKKPASCGHAISAWMLQSGKRLTWGLCGLWVSLGAWAPPPPTWGQTAAEETRVRIVLSGAQAVRDDVKYVVELAPTHLKKQAKTIDETLESFQQGVDPLKPIAIDLVFSGSELVYQPIIPVKEFEGRKGFLANLKDFGWKIDGPQNGLYTISEPPRASSRSSKKDSKKDTATPPPARPFYMRYQHGHAFLASRSQSLPAQLPDPSRDLKTLIDAHDAVLMLENTADTLTARRAGLAEFRKQTMAALKFKRGETEAEFNLRKLLAEQSLDELEHYLVEARRLQITWSTSADEHRGRGGLLLEGLPGTTLEQAIGLLARKPSVFAGVSFVHQKPVLALRSSFTLDPARAARLHAQYAAMLPVAQESVARDKDLSEEQKAAATEALQKFFQILDDSRTLDSIDVYGELYPATEGYTGVCGITCTDAQQVVELLQLLPKIREGWRLETSIETHGETKLHRLHLPPNRHEEFHVLFAGEPVVYVGTRGPLLWLAAGTQALDALKRAIDEQQQAPVPEVANPVFFEARGNLLPVVDLISLWRSRRSKPESADPESQRLAQEIEKHLTKVKRYAKESLGGCDNAMEGWLKREGSSIVGEVIVHECFLRLVGSLTADWAAENLQ